jgi:NADH-quinone oxidoreductase subunit M
VNWPVLSITTALPLVGGLLCCLANRRANVARAIALATSGLVLLLVLITAAQFSRTVAGLQFIEQHLWIASPKVDYFLGLDGINLVFLLLTALVIPMGIATSWNQADRPHLYFGLILLLQAGLIGTFTALNFFHWFLFWELSLIPAFFLVKLWGGAQRGSAATQFFVYTMAGSIAMLLGFLALYNLSGSFDLIKLAELREQGVFGQTSQKLKVLAFVGIFLGLAVKVPIMPFHSWLPPAYSEASSPVTMLLTGVMSKMGVYGMLRILLPIFPDEMRAAMQPLMGLALLTILFSAWAALGQTDIKKMLAYSSINHLGYCALAIFAAAKFTGPNILFGNEKAAALNGVLLQVFSHGLIASALFAFVHFIEKRSGGLRQLNQFGGLRRVAPLFCGLMGIAIFASLGLPGLSGFAAEFLMFKGSVALAKVAAFPAALGLLITAIFLLKLLQQLFYGPLNERYANWPELTIAERFVIGPALLIVFLLGIYPQILVQFLNPAVFRIVAQLNQ